MSTGDGVAQCPVCGEYYYIQIGHTCKRLKECQDDFATVAVMSEGWRIKYTDLLRRLREAVADIRKGQTMMIDEDSETVEYCLDRLYGYCPELED